VAKLQLKGHVADGDD